MRRGEGDRAARRCAQVAIGYAGLKDRNAVTTQHFRLAAGARGAGLTMIEDESLQVIDAQRHNHQDPPWLAARQSLQIRGRQRGG